MVGDDRYDALFDELCRRMGFCSIGVEGENAVRSLVDADAPTIARAVFAAEGLDFDSYRPETVKVGVVACVARHLDLETRP